MPTSTWQDTSKYNTSFTYYCDNDCATAHTNDRKDYDWYHPAGAVYYKVMY